MTKNVNKELLNSYYDNEISGAAKRGMAERLVADPESQAVLDGMERMSALLVERNEMALEEVSFDGFADSVQRKIAAQPEKQSLFESVSVWLKEVFDYKKVIWVPAASVMGAAALAMLVVTTETETTAVPGMPDTSAGQIWQASAGVSGGSELFIEESESLKATTYSVDSKQGAMIGVVWIEE